MPYRSAQNIHFFQFETFDSLPVEHGIFTRQGGVSPSPWSSLNVGGTVGDEAERVRTNQQRAFTALGRPMDSLFDVWQVHSSDYVNARSPRNGKPHSKADVIVTDNSDLTLFMRFADCVPIMLVDPNKRAIALAHAGWLGTVRGAALSAVAALEQHFGSKPHHLHAGLGPSIGPDHYAVGQDVLERYRERFPTEAETHIQARDGQLYMDLWSANESQLRSVGVDLIEIARLCTACDVARWFSHRAEGGRTGRFGALLALRS